MSYIPHAMVFYFFSSRNIALYFQYIFTPLNPDNKLRDRWRPRRHSTLPPLLLLLSRPYLTRESRRVRVQPAVTIKSPLRIQWLSLPYFHLFAAIPIIDPNTRAPVDTGSQQAEGASNPESASSSARGTPNPTASHIQVAVSTASANIVL